MKTYASLHNHSDYSNLKLIDSINTVSSLIDKAYELGLSAVAITDHDALSGHVKAIQHYKKNYSDKDFKLILGNEIYLTYEGLTAETYEKGDKFYHIVLLAKDKVGHEQLRKLSSRAWDRSFVRGIMRTPTYGSDLREIVGENKGHIVATTACLGGVPGSMFLANGEMAVGSIRDFLTSMEEVFGKGNFYIELQPSNQKDQIKYNDFMIAHFWGEFPFTFATDSHYGEKKDSVVHKYFLNSKHGDREVDDFYSSAYLMNLEEVYEYFYTHIDVDKLEEMRLNTIKIADMCEFYDLAHEQIVPKIPTDITPEMMGGWEAFMPLIQDAKLKFNREYKYITKYIQSNDDNDTYFIINILNGFYKLIGSWRHLSEDSDFFEYFDRLEYELEQLWETSITIKQPISSYFNTMAKMIDIIWEDGDSLVGDGRGSAVGFLVNYCLGITQLDPLRQELEIVPWRFIHKDRPGLPDIDIDTEGDKRTKVFNKVQEYFQSIGGDVVNVCTFGTEKSKSALRTAARGLSIDDDVVGYVVSMIPNERGFDWTLSQCMYGDDEKKPIKKFVEEMEKYPVLWEVASKIEGLITRLGVHAAGIIAVNEEFTKYNSLMKTSKGVPVSAFNLDDTEYAGGLKYDFLTINGLDKIRTTMNLLLEDDVIEWQGSLRETYNKYLLPKNLDYKSQEMWEMAYTGQIVDLFQFDTPVGAQAIKSIKPQNIAELAIANSLMRLMPQGADEMPADTYVRYKNNIDLWYAEMRRYGLTQEEMKILEPYLLPLSGVADSQESVMMMVMDKNVANFNVTESNSLRKAIAKKKADVLAKTEKMFYDKGEEVGTSKALLDYVWKAQIGRQIGYSFSVLHTMAYSTIALQEMNLAYKYPIIYWNTACLSVNAGAINEEDYTNLLSQGILEITDEEDKRSSNKVQYGKVASAISKFRDDLGVQVELPDINIAKFGFTPNAERNSIVFGMKGISRIGDALIEEIMDRRPYTSLNDFISKMTFNGKKLISKDRVVNLIKAGAFDNIEQDTRENILEKYVRSIADQKKRINLMNMLMLIRKGLVPDHLIEEAKVYNFTKYIRKHKFLSSYYILDEIAKEYYVEKGHDLNQIKRLKKDNEVVECIPMGSWDAYYDMKMDNVRKWMKANQMEILTTLNDMLFQEEFNKYAKGNKLRWELDALNFYHSGHELSGLELPIDITKLTDLKENEIIGHWRIKDKQTGEIKTPPKYQLRAIMGTVLDKDKTKHLVTLSTPEGVIDIKIYRTQFSKYDQVLSHIDESGNKVIDQDSFLKKGTHLAIIGIKRGDVFVPKVYKTTGMSPINKIIITQDGKFSHFEEKQ